jgi:hypothetical protein
MRLRTWLKGSAHLPNKHQNLSSNPSNTFCKKKEKEKKLFSHSTRLNLETVTVGGTEIEKQR